MVRNSLPLSAFAAICLLAFLHPASAQAATPGGNSCTATGIFSSCTASCPPGQTPVCTTGFLGTSTSCTCSGGSGSTSLQVGQAAEVAYDGYVKLLSALTSKESLEVSASAEAMMDAARDDDADTYAKAAAAHEESLRKLPSAELEDVYEYLKVPKP